MQNIADICHNNLLNRKWLIVPSIQTGTSWLEYFVRLGGACVNVIPVTIERFALELTSSHLANDNRWLLPECLTSVIVQDAWNSLPTDGHLRSVLSPAADSFLRVAVTIQDLRRQNICDVDLHKTTNEVPKTKADDFAILLKAWQAYLDKHRFADAAMILNLALDAVANGKLPAKDLILLPENSQFHGLESQLLRAVPGDQIIELESPLLLSTEDDDDGEFGLNLFRAIDAVSECREIVRQCLVNEVPLDGVEIMHTAAATYVPLLVEALSLATAADSPLPMTFEDGLPVGLSRPLKAFECWRRWMTDGFAPALLEQLYANDLLQASGHSNHTLATVLHSLNLSTNCDDVLVQLERQSALLKSQISHSPNAGGNDPQVTSRYEVQQDQIKTLIDTITQLSNLAEAIVGSDAEAAVSAATEFLTKNAKAISAFDRLSCIEVVKGIQHQNKRLKSLGIQVNVGEWLDALTGNLSYKASGPKPGMLHVASLETGGKSGRLMTFIAGLDEQRFPGEVMQDDVLTDSERKSLGDDFPTHAGRRESQLFGIQQMLSQLRGDLTVSWPCTGEADGSEVDASPLVHKFGQMMLGTADPDWDTDQLNELAGEPISLSAVATGSDPKLSAPTYRLRTLNSDSAGYGDVDALNEDQSRQDVSGALTSVLEIATTRPGVDLKNLAIAALRSQSVPMNLLNEVIAVAQNVIQSDFWKRVEQSQSRFAHVCISELSDEQLPTVASGIVNLAFQETSGWVLVNFKHWPEDFCGVAVMTEACDAELQALARCWAAVTDEPVAEAAIFFTNQQTLVPTQLNDK